MPVPDNRLHVLSGINASKKIVPTSLTFVDIAGLVAGASKGEGLGNKFLANIRECDAIVHVVPARLPQIRLPLSLHSLADVAFSCLVVWAA